MQILCCHGFAQRRQDETCRRRDEELVPLAWQKSPTSPFADLRCHLRSAKHDLIPRHLKPQKCNKQSNHVAGQSIPSASTPARVT
eukprot:750130-Hanusia_phi.AAC.8